MTFNVTQMSEDALELIPWLRNCLEYNLSQ